jgi:hypothetical protein
MTKARKGGTCNSRTRKNEKNEKKWPFLSEKVPLFAAKLVKKCHNKIPTTLETVEKVKFIYFNISFLKLRSIIFTPEIVN